jgi:hypothetical protein
MCQICFILRFLNNFITINYDIIIDIMSILIYSYMLKQIDLARYEYAKFRGGFIETIDFK